MLHALIPWSTLPVSLRAGSAHGSPDSVLKLLPPRSHSSSSSSSDHSSFGKSSRSDYHGQRQRLLPSAHPSSHNLPESQLHGSANSPVEFIHRGPDGRFVVEPYEEVSTVAPPRHTKPREDIGQSSGVEVSAIRKSNSLQSYRDERRHPPFVLSVDMPSCGSDIFSSGRVQARAKHLSLHGCYFQEEELANWPLDQTSLSSEGSVLYPQSNNYMSLNRGSTRSTASTLVLQMEHEKEKGNLSHCLKLAREREELEQELRKYSLGRHTPVSYSKTEGLLNVEQRTDLEDVVGTVWKSKETGSLHHKELSSRGRSHTSSLEARASSCIPWVASPMMSSSDLVEAHPGNERDGERLEDCHLRQICNHQRSKSLERGEHQRSITKDRRRRRTMTEGSTVTIEDEPFYPTLKGSHYSAEGSPRMPRTYSHNQHHIVQSMSPSLDNQEERMAKRKTGQTGDYVEMSVDEPEVQAQTPLKRSMTDHGHHMLAYNRPCLYQLERESEMEKEAGSRTIRRGLKRDLSLRSSSTLPSQKPFQKGLCVSSQRENHHRSVPSLDSRMYKEQFLTPDAWIDSLSPHQNSILSPFAHHPSSEVQEDHRIPNQEANLLVPSQTEQQESSLQRVSNSPALDSHCHIVSPRHSPHTLPPESSSRSLSHCHPLQAKADQRREVEEVEEDGTEVDMEIRGYRSVPEPEGSCSSYASQSSGRGSLDHPSSRQSLSLSPPLTSSPETTEESDKDDGALQESAVREW